MIPVKWKILNELPFQYYTMIPQDMIFKSSERLLQKPYSQNEFIFYSQNGASFRPDVDFYIINENVIYHHNGRSFKWLIERFDIFKYSVDGTDYDFNKNKILNSNNLFFCSIKDNSITSLNQECAEIVKTNYNKLDKLKQKSLEEFIDFYRL